MSVPALIQQAAEGHFAKFTTRYHTKISAMAAQLEVSFEQCYLLLARRSFPFSTEDIAWAKKQEPLLTEQQFLEGQMGKDTPPKNLK